MSTSFDINSWERDWVTRVIAATSNIHGDPAMAKLINADTEVQFGNNPVVKGLDNSMLVIGEIYKRAATFTKEVTRVHIDVPSNTVFINYIVHATAKGDSEAEEILVPTAMVLVKPLGKQQESIQRMEVYNDFTPLVNRAKEVGFA